MLNVFIGYDPRQPVAYQTAAHSVWSRSTIPVAITRLQLSQLPIKRRGLTEFTYSRYLAPYLCNYEGWSIFLDSDMLCLGDIRELLGYAQKETEVRKIDNQDTAVCVVLHDRVFERPSMMVFNNSLCTKLTPQWIDNTNTNPFDLPTWAGENVGALPTFWNHLVGYDTPNPSAKLIHYTMGVPCWPETKNCEFATEWLAEAKQTVASVSYAELMGKSVHHQHVQAGVLKKT